MDSLIEVKTNYNEASIFLDVNMWSVCLHDPESYYSLC